MNIRIRKMDLSDIPYVYRQETKIFGVSLGEKTLYNEIIYNDLSRYYMALLNGKRAGYIGSWLTIPNAEILNLFVEEKYRGNGIGRELIKHVISVCEDNNIEHITLEVRVSNIRAQNLYKDLGFEIATTRKQYYENGEDAYLMMYTIGVKE
jgi:ribosomal-protein-alanine N-acetyltransferase